MIVPVARWMLDAWFAWVPIGLFTYWAAEEIIEQVDAWDARRAGE